MAHPMKRTKSKGPRRFSDVPFERYVKRPPADTADERAAKERAITEFMAGKRAAGSTTVDISGKIRDR